MGTQVAISQNPFETPAQLAARVGLPVANIRHLIKTQQLDHIFTSPGKRNPKIPAGSWESYLELNTIRAKCKREPQ